jgi:hypothetical protein
MADALVSARVAEAGDVLAVAAELSRLPTGKWTGDLVALL